MSKPVLVTGASGTIGRDVARQLSAEGVAVRAGVRDQARARKQFSADIALVPFDFENEKTFSEALGGIEKVFLLPPLLPNQLDVMNTFVDAAERAGVRHIVKLSAIGIDDTMQPTAIKGHAANEQHIRESGLAFTFLRPNSFMQNFITYFLPRNGAIYLPWGNGTATFVDTRNIASVAAEVLTRDGHEGQIYTLTGPAALECRKPRRKCQIFRHDPVSIPSHAKKRDAEYSFLFVHPDGSQLAKIGELLEVGSIRPVIDKVFP